MTKKDFIAIAAIIREHLEDNRKCESHRAMDVLDNKEPSLSRDFLEARGMLLYELTAQLTHHFEESNPAFDRYKFYEACSIPPLHSKSLPA